MSDHFLVLVIVIMPLDDLQNINFDLWKAASLKNKYDCHLAAVVVSKLRANDISV